MKTSDNFNSLYILKYSKDLQSIIIIDHKKLVRLLRLTGQLETRRGTQNFVRRFHKTTFFLTFRKATVHPESVVEISVFSQHFNFLHSRVFIFVHR